MADGSGRSWSLSCLFEDFDGDEQLGTFADEGLQDSAEKTTRMRDSRKLLIRLYDNLKTQFVDEGRDDELSQTSDKIRDYSKLEIHFSNWCKSRKELIRTTIYAAEELDKSLLIVNTARIISSGIEIFNSFNLGICESITSYAYNTSTYLGFVVERALELTFQLRVIDFVYSFFHILLSQKVFRRVVIALKNDKDKFMPLKEWFDETKELDELVKMLFPYVINEKITKSMENSLEYLEIEKEIFSATVLSNLMEDPIIHKNRKFMLEAFLFSKSDAGKEWYKRFRMGAYNLDLEYEMFYLRSELLQLEEAGFDSTLKLELGKHILIGILTKNILSNLGRLLICGISGMSVYYCYQNIRAGSKHKYSDKLREFSTRAQSFLNKMEKIRF